MTKLLLLLRTSRFAQGALALALSLSLAAFYHNSAVNSAFEAGYEAAQEEARANDAERASEIRRRARAAGLRTDLQPRGPVASEHGGGSDAGAGDVSGRVFDPDPSDARGYRD